MSALDQILRRTTGAILAVCAVIILFALIQPGRAQDQPTPDAALERLVSDARAEAAAGDTCGQPGLDRLVQLFCRGQIRIGVRENYPLFGTAEGAARKGYDVDVGRAIGERLGLPVTFVRVNATTRIAMLEADRIDLTIATMGHTTQRDGQARFIRPHYYQSETILVGPHALQIGDWEDASARTICVTIGNGSNAQIVSQGVRVMLFEEAGYLVDRLRDETCTLAAQDDSFFAYYLNQPDFAARFGQKFGFSRVPWGMAVAKTGSDRLGTALDTLSQVFHRDGVFLRLAKDNKIRTVFLEEQQQVWSRSDCNEPSGRANPACVLPALETSFKLTSFAPAMQAFETWLATTAGLSVPLPMFQLSPAWSLFKAGVVNSLILVVGALLTTLGFALLIGAALGSRSMLLRLPARTVVAVMQSSPVVLTLVIAAAVAQIIVPYSAGVALVAAMIALGLTNGSNAGQAVGEAIQTLRDERGGHGTSGGMLRPAVGRSATQIVSFLVNAAKGTPVASFIGAPELLSALTDVTSFAANGRATAYTLLLIFYIVIISIVVWLCGRLRHYLVRAQGTA
jgi:ABC-type amino acid transport substrate-binding protein/ABC-type amino acid transport system permease subunit